MSAKRPWRKSASVSTASPILHAHIVEVHAAGLDRAARLGGGVEQACGLGDVDDAVAGRGGREGARPVLAGHLEAIEHGLQGLPVDGGQIGVK